MSEAEGRMTEEGTRSEGEIAGKTMAHWSGTRKNKVEEDGRNRWREQRCGFKFFPAAGHVSKQRVVRKRRESNIKPLHMYVTGWYWPGREAKQKKALFAGFSFSSPWLNHIYTPVARTEI